MSTRAQKTFSFGPRHPSVVLPPGVSEKLRALVARLLLQAIRRQRTGREGNEERK